MTSELDLTPVHSNFHWRSRLRSVLDDYYRRDLFRLCHLGLCRLVYQRIVEGRELLFVACDKMVALLALLMLEAVFELADITPADHDFSALLTPVVG